ncbi:MAG: restriction endonuclease subunit S, partial [Paludibacteraceae bacterium]|nr:restriction endonuclease subunit S [Paludibacteraceae bacterium]
MDTKQLKQKILDLAIRGKLVPQDPNDEPASVLLERIRKEKEQLIAAGKLKKSKSKTTDTPHYENVPFEIPDSWESTTLGDVYQHNTGKALNANDRNGTLKDYITTSNLYWSRFVLQEVRKMLFTESEIERCLVTRGDLLVCEGGDVGRAAIWCYDYDICIQNHIHRLRSILPLCNQFYYYIFYLYKLTNRIGGKGTAIQGLSSDSIDKLLIPLPPLIEQKRIVAEIERWFALIDEIENSKLELQDVINQTKSKVLSLAISGKLVPQDPNDEPAIELLRRINPNYTPCDTSHYENLPNGWTISTVGEVADYINGRAFKPSEWELTGLPIIRIQNLNDE